MSSFSLKFLRNIIFRFRSWILARPSFTNLLRSDVAAESCVVSDPKPIWGYFACYARMKNLASPTGFEPVLSA